MHRGTRRQFDRFQVQPAGLAQPGEDDPQQQIYFLGDLVLDRFDRFFPGL